MIKNSHVLFFCDALGHATACSVVGIPFVVFAGVAYRSYVWLISGVWPEITLMSLDLDILSSWAGVRMMPLEILVALALLAFAIICFAVFRGIVSVYGVVEPD